MSVIGIITCEVLEQEIAYVLASDDELKQIVVLEDARSKHLIEALRARAVPNLQCIPHVASFQPEPHAPLAVLVRVLEIGLHRNQKLLRTALCSAAHELAPRVDVLMLGYGLCGNTITDAKTMLDVPIPVVVPMDQGHPVDDCVALSLGGRERYCQEQRNVPGTFFMTPGWSYHWKKTFDGALSVGSDVARRIFAHYTRSLLITTPVMREEKMRQNSEEFNTTLDLRVEACPGTLDILKTAWTSAKASACIAAGEGREVVLQGAQPCD